jgi:hypothetical protein
MVASLTELHRLYNALLNITEKTNDIYDLKKIQNLFFIKSRVNIRPDLDPTWVKKIGGLQQDVTRFSEEALFCMKSMTNVTT